MNQLDKYMGTLKIAKRTCLFMTIAYALVILGLVATSMMSNHNLLINAGNQIGSFLLWWLLFTVLRTLLVIVDELRTTV